MILLEARDVEFLPCTGLFEETLETFRGQRSGALSLSDAAIVTVARREPGTPVATFDPDLRAVGVAIVPG